MADVPAPTPDATAVEAVAAAAVEVGGGGEPPSAAAAPTVPAGDGGREGQARIGPYTLGRTLGTGSTCTLVAAASKVLLWWTLGRLVCCDVLLGEMHLMSCCRLVTLGLLIVGWRHVCLSGR